jgi:hypothetical protein
VGDTIVDIKIIKTDRILMEARGGGGGAGEIEIETSRLNPTEPRFHPIDDRLLAGQITGNDRDRNDNAHDLNNQKT